MFCAEFCITFVSVDCHCILFFGIVFNVPFTNTALGGCTCVNIPVVTTVFNNTYYGELILISVEL